MGVRFLIQNQSEVSKVSKPEEPGVEEVELEVFEEGGSVVRASLYVNFRESRFPAPQAIFRGGEMEAILKDMDEKSAFLKDLGINMNLTPVADVPAHSESFIYARSLGQDAKTTAEYVSEVVSRMNLDGIISVMKHFPGYGDNVDTHKTVAIDERSYEVFREYVFCLSKLELRWMVQRS